MAQENQGLRPINLGSTLTLVELQYFKCSDCPGEFTGLLEDGRCIPCSQKAVEKKKIARLRAERMTEALGGPKAVAEYTFETLQVDPGNREAIGHGRAFRTLNQNLYLCGPCGNGKTHLAVAIAREAWDAGRDALVLKPRDLTNRLRMKDSQEQDRQMEKLVKMDVLVIDDLGIGRATDFALEILCDLVDRRIMTYRNGLVVTSNLAPEELANKLEDDRLVSRLAGMCRVVKMDTGRDWRMKA